MSTQRKNSKMPVAQDVLSTLSVEPKKPGLVESTTDLEIVKPDLDLPVGVPVETFIINPEPDLDAVCAKPVPLEMPMAELLRPEAIWTVDQWLDHAVAKWEGGRLLEKKTGPEYWDAGYAIGQAHRKYVAEQKFGWVQVVTKRFGAYATARQLERIAETIKREEAEGYSLTDLKYKCGIVSLKETYQPTAWKDAWTPEWEQPATLTLNAEGSTGAGDSAKDATDVNRVKDDTGDDNETRWEQAVQDAKNATASSSSSPASTSPVPASSGPSAKKQPVDWNANLKKLGDVESMLREVLADAEADPPDQKIHKNLLPQASELLMVGLDLEEALKKQ